jgi:hypothetical protein
LRPLTLGFACATFEVIANVGQGADQTQRLRLPDRVQHIGCRGQDAGDPSPDVLNAGFAALFGFEIDALFDEVGPARRINPILRVGAGVKVLVQRLGKRRPTRSRVLGEEPSGLRVVPACPQVVHSQICVELLAAVEVVVRRRARGGYLLPNASYS